MIDIRNETMSQPQSSLAEYPETTVLASSDLGTVYRSLDPETGQDVVVKILAVNGAAINAAVQDNFLHDMRTLQFLSLPAFPKILNYGFTEDEDAFLVMEWVDGENLADLSNVQPKRLIPILIQIADALEVLAMGEAYHHNLSPDNILIQARPEGDVVKIVGLGTAVCSRGAGEGVPSRTSAEYRRFIAPELIQGSSEIGELGVLPDIYSLALIAVNLLGADVESLGSNDPKVRFPEAVGDDISNAGILEDALSDALAVTPDKRQTTYAILKNAFEWDFDFMEGISSDEGLTRELAAQDKRPGPPPLPEPPGPDEKSLRAAPRKVSAITDDDTTLILETPGESDPIDEDLIQTGPTSFDPNKTDPLYIPPSTDPPGLPEDQPPEASEVPPIPQGGKRIPSLDRRLLLWLTGGFAIVAILGLTTVMVWRLAHRSPPKPPPVTVIQSTPAPPVPTPEIPSEDQVHPGLEQADLLLLDGDVEGARAILSAITPEEIQLFSPEESATYEAMVNSLEGSRFDAAVSDLKGGLDHGSIRMLKRGVAGLRKIDSEQLAGEPGVEALLKRAQSALRLHALLWEAQKKQDYPLMMERAYSMIEALPKYSTSFKFREEAARALEERSDQAQKEGDYAQARHLLQPIDTYWPDRPGLTRRMSATHEAEQKLETQRAQIVKALAQGREGDPEAALALLNTFTPVNLLQTSHAEALTLLRQHLVEIDANPPNLILAPESEMTFKKKKTVTIQVTVTDDHRVADVAAYLKTAGAGSFSKIELNLDRSTNSCTFEIGPETHKNDDFFLYVEAVDGSGHIGRLASPNAPLEFKRKRGLKALFGR